MDEIKRAVEQARRAWVIRRLREYPHLKTRINFAQKTINDLLRGVDGLKSPVPSDMPHSYSPSDRTYNQALRLQDTYKQVIDLEREIEADKAEIKIIDSAIQELNPTERFVIENRYIRPASQKYYRVLARNKGYAESTLKNAHTSAIKKISRIL